MGRRPEILEVGKVIQRPTDGQLDQAGWLPEARRLVEGNHIPTARAVRRVVVGHHTAVIGEAVRQQQINRMGTENPRRVSGSPPPERQ